MKIKHLITPTVTALACIGLHSCTTNLGSTSGGGLSAYQSYDRPASLPTNPSKVRVKVSTSKQIAYVMEGTKPLLVMPVSVGTSSTPTPKGTFRIFKKEHRHRANSHGYAYSGDNVRQCYLSKKPGGWRFKGTPMPYWCEFKANYGFHTGWMKHHPCTHGCIRMHENVAPKFFRLVKNGTPVNIATSQPEDSTLGRNVPRPPDAGPLPDYSGSFMLGDGYFNRHRSAKFQ
ncbi:MAG: L,D-transpeptidase [Verrucomicrobiae bacterium]|nr:L,D-transpeptidase [Verrucomicrobiae bacterium]NNJ42274.1 L,D-transpeptidase [Akkermansiaceae bacterium]